jgi:STE24 endopeptidase
MANAQDTFTMPKIDSSSAAAQIQQTIPSTDSAPADTIYPVTLERRAMLNKYSDFRLGWEVFYEILQWVLLLGILFWGFSAKIQKYCEGITKNTIGQFLLFIFFYLLLMTVLTLPFDYYRDFVVEHQYGFSNQSFGAWIGDQLKSFPIAYIAMSIIIGLLYFLLKKFPRKWWLYFAIGFVPIMVISIIIIPVFVSPIFNKFEPLQDQELKTEILSLASKAGIEGADVFQVDASKQSNKLNAYVTGLWGTKRIVLYDTIIKAMTRDEVKFVMAHEMGHYVKNHVWIIVGMMSIIMFFVLWLTSGILPRLIRRYSMRWGFDDLASFSSLPLIMLVLTFILFFIQPVTNGIGRQFEHASDKYGMEMTGFNSEAAAVAFEKLSAYNLSNPNPGRLTEIWFYDHPALQKRIDFVKEYGKAHGNTP